MLGITMNENQFAELLGHAALKVWPDLPQDCKSGFSPPLSTMVS